MYGLIDKNGRLREDFDRKSDAIDELIRIEGKRPGATASWMLLAYDDAGKQVGEPEWAEDLLTAQLPPIAMTFPSFNTGHKHLMAAQVEYVVITSLGQGADWFGTRVSIDPAFSRRYVGATHTRSQAQEEVAAP
jgi:hypothetical protein